MTSGISVKRFVSELNSSNERSKENRDTDVLDTVNAVANLVVQEPDSFTLFDNLAPLLLGALSASFVSAAQVMEKVVGHVSNAGNGSANPMASIIVRECLEWTAQKRQSFFLYSSSELVPGTGTRLGELGWTQLIMTPVLHHGGHTTGVLLAANSNENYSFSANHAQLLDTVSKQLAVGIDRAQLLGRLDEWSHGMEALLSFSAAVHRQREPETLVNEMVENAASFLKADGGRAGLVGVNDRGERVIESWCRSFGGKRIIENRVWGHNEGIPGRVLEREFPYLSADYGADSAADPELLQEGQIRFSLCVPIKDSSHTVIGFFELHRSGDRSPFTWNEAAFLESLADTTAMAIENSRLVMALASKNEEIRLLFARHADRLEEERQHIARELHDEAGQALVGVKLSLQALSRALAEAGLQSVQTPLDELRLQVNQATARFRQLARRLRPPSLDQHGLDIALSQMAHELEERTGMKVRLDASWRPSRRLPLLETAIFRITQEAFTNIAAHSQAAEVSAELSSTETEVLLEVCDNGCGFDTESATAGLGLRGIEERVHMFGGDFRIESSPDNGTRLWVRLPVS